MKNITTKKLYQRQTTLAEFGEVAQEKLRKAKVIVIGCGGLGNAAAVYLGASGIGRIHLVDFDSVDVSNLHRQVFFKVKDIGKSKSKVLAKYIQSVSPFVQVSYSKTPISKSNVEKAIRDYDIVLDCTDSLPIKYLINDACILQDKILVYGSLYKFDGYVATFNLLGNDGLRSSNLRDAFPEIPENSIPNCSEAGTLNTIVGIIGLIQANEVIKIVADIGMPLTNQLLIYNSLDNSQYKMKLKNTFVKEKIRSLFEKEYYTNVNCELQDEELLISAVELKNKIAKCKNLKVISVIENMDAELPFKVDLKIPLSRLEIEKLVIEKDKEYVIICNKGISSYVAVKRIIKAYPNLNVLNLKNGIINY
jgi:molybdopterin/thiamine biosynthesis adenylyltransferase/rhodanese-related sulfurtransferase